MMTNNEIYCIKQTVRKIPDFKLYKMTRSVNSHVPSDVIKYSHFDKYIVSKRKLKAIK